MKVNDLSLLDLRRLLWRSLAGHARLVAIAGSDSWNALTRSDSPASVIVPESYLGVTCVPQSRAEV